MAKDQVSEGAHVLDVCVDYVGRDGADDMDEIARRFCTQATVPLVLDSTEPQVMEAGLQWLGGRAILNSANLEDGEARRLRASTACSRWPRSTAPPSSACCIDEEGQARDVEWKLRVAHRIHDLAVDRYGLEPEDLFFDALTLPAVHRRRGPARRRHGDHRGHPAHQGRAARRATRPSASRTCRFGLNPAARHVLNSVFLHECVQAGLDSAIVHAARIMPLARIPDEQREVCLDLIYDRRDPAAGYDPLQELLEVFEGVKAADGREGGPHRLADRAAPVAAHHRRRPRRPRRPTSTRPWATGSRRSAIINDVLLAGMKVVGELFGTGEMQLPFVLQSAETMKTAVALPRAAHGEGRRSGGKGRIVLATVKGDVHDIGKNLVDIILTNNGYEVHNLGIKVGDLRDDREGPRGQGRRHRHERSAGEVDADHAGEPARS